ncbi:hypothetical protein GpartN1_g7686.t1 [Galdieria partita]|uniref:Uncharacterized protein n=1 Tax=Galdieria partita TaxID=83374 RepID=A0A9C7UV21_9RHOD|nr:hypothetical protein GpartN1_g7686.t1 [Galdieria partita]
MNDHFSTDMEEERFRRVAKSLAGNEKHRRLKALEMVELWLTAHASQVEPIELSKLCRALFYAIWLSDEASTTEKITQHVAKFIQIGKSKYLKALWECVGSLWPKLDMYRLDKFYDLVTACLDEIAVIGDNQEWTEQKMRELVTVMEETITEHWRYTSKGLCLHVIDQYYEHVIRKALYCASSSNKVDVLWSLFHICLNDAIQTDSLLATRTRERILLPFVQECKTAATEQRYELLFVTRQWLSKLYPFASSPQRPSKARKSLYTFYSELETLVSCLDSPQVSETSPVKRRRSERLLSKKSQSTTKNSTDLPAVKQVRFSLDKNEEYILPALKKRRTRPLLSSLWTFELH